MQRKFYTLRSELASLYASNYVDEYHVAELEHTIKETTVNAEMGMLVVPLGGNRFWYMSDLVELPEYVGVVGEDGLTSMMRLVTTSLTDGIQYEEIAKLSESFDSDVKYMTPDNTQSFTDGSVVTPLLMLSSNERITVLSSTDVLTLYIVQDGIIIENGVTYEKIASYTP